MVMMLGEYNSKGIGVGSDFLFLKVSFSGTSLDVLTNDIYTIIRRE
jgi:hypothetical protein